MAADSTAGHLSVAGVEAFCERQIGDVVEVAGGLMTLQIWVNIAGMKTTAGVVADTGEAENTLKLQPFEMCKRKLTFSNMVATC